MDPLKPLPPAAPLTADQQAALKKLHAAATQLEGVFVGMLFKEMQSTVPTDDGIFGKQSNADGIWKDMLSTEQANQAAKSGSFGIAKLVEDQLRAQVLASSSAVPKVPGSLTTPTVPPAMAAPTLLQPSSDEDQP
ncbi:MAG: rod-binding protein [Candidatus Lustribacter sp.]|jgi:Rod binding domain-containing protein